MYWWKKLLFVSSYKVWFRFQNFVSCSVSYSINWIVTQVGFFPGPKTWSKALTGVGRGITSPFHGDFYFNFHLSWLMCKSWMLQRLEKLICLVRSFSISCDIFWLTYLPEQMEIGKLAFTGDPGGLPSTFVPLHFLLCTLVTMIDYNTVDMEMPKYFGLEKPFLI